MVKIRLVDDRRRKLTGLAVLLLVLLTIALATMPTDAQAPEVGTTTVTFNVGEAIEVLSWPASSFSLSATAIPGEPVVSDVLSIEVRANALWGVQVHSDAANGMLREFDVSASSYVAGGAETGPVEWATHVDGPWTPLSSAPATMFTQQPPTGSEGSSVAFLLRVTPSFDDRPLGGGRIYQIVLTYTAGVGF